MTFIKFITTGVDAPSENGAHLVA